MNCISLSPRAGPPADFPTASLGVPVLKQHALKVVLRLGIPRTRETRPARFHRRCGERRSCRGGWSPIEQVGQWTKPTELLRKNEDRRTNWLTSRDEIPLTEFSIAAANNRIRFIIQSSGSHNGEDSEENLITLCATSFVHGSHSLATSAASYCE